MILVNIIINTITIFPEPNIDNANIGDIEDENLVPTLQLSWFPKTQLAVFPSGMFSNQSATWDFCFWVGQQIC